MCGPVGLHERRAQATAASPPPLHPLRLAACRHLVCVGDNRHTYLYQATPVCYRQCAVFTEGCDAGMCCAWSAAGERSWWGGAIAQGSVHAGCGGAARRLCGEWLAPAGRQSGR